MLGSAPDVDRGREATALRLLGGFDAHVALLHSLLAVTATDPTPDTDAAAVSHLRRCTFRRLVAVQRNPRPAYGVECLYPDRQVPIPLGDLASARPICDACRADHIFRPDED